MPKSDVCVQKFMVSFKNHHNPPLMGTIYLSSKVSGTVRHLFVKLTTLK